MERRTKGRDPGALEERLVEFAASACRVGARLPATGPGRHIALQLYKSGTAPAANYAEARAAASRKDFKHKLRPCLKELRETGVWLRLVQRLGLTDSAALATALGECDELIAIFVTSVRTVGMKSDD